jgi:hypothetical protein
MGILEIIDEAAYLARKPILPPLCADCRAARNRWLDHTGPLHRGTQIAQVGTGDHNVPTWARTHDALKKQVELIADICRIHHAEESA